MLCEFLNYCRSNQGMSKASVGSSEQAAFQRKTLRITLKGFMVRFFFPAVTGDGNKTNDSETRTGSSELAWRFGLVPLSTTCHLCGGAGRVAEPRASCGCSWALPSMSRRWALRAPLCSRTGPCFLETVPRCPGFAQGPLCKAMRGG